MTDYKEVRTEQRESGQSQRVTTFRLTQIIWLLFGLLEAAIGLRIFFKLIGANPGNPFAAFLYDVTGLFLAPFVSLIRSPAADGIVFEVSSLIALLVYALIAWALTKIVYVIFYRTRGTVSVRQTVIAEHADNPDEENSDPQ